MGLRALILCLLAGLLGAGEAVKAPPSVPPSPPVVPPAGLLRIGDLGSMPDPSLYDARFPEMEEWAKAGVQGGIPVVERVLATLAPADDLQGAIDRAEAGPGRLGVLLLQPGTYALDKPLKLKNGVILRGVSRQGSILAFSLASGTCIRLAEWSALEDLTAQNALVKARPEAEYLGKYENGGPSDACTVAFGGSNAWIQRCDILYAGKNPVEIHNGKAGHITVRDTLVDKAYNKGGQGSGYFDISESHHVLLYNVSIRNIRHLSIMFNATYVVVYGCHLGVDINYHDGCPSKTLIEKTVVERRAGHHWGSVCYGWEPWQDDGPGPRNFLWRTKLDNGEAAGEQKVYVLRDTTPKYKNMPVKEPMILDFGAPPAKGTLYAVTGRDIPAEDVEKGRVLERMINAQKARDWARAIPLALTAQRLFKEGEAPHAQAGGLLAEAEKLAGEALLRVRSKPTPALFRALLGTFAGTQAAEQGLALAGTTAAAAWKGIIDANQKPGAGQVRSYLTDWSGLVPVEAAQACFEELADEDLVRRKAGLVSPAALRTFVHAWPGTKAATAAQTDFDRRLRAVLDDLIARKAGMNRQERQRCAAQFAGTSLEAEAKKALE